MQQTIDVLKDKASIWAGLGLFLSWMLTIFSFEGIIRAESANVFIGIVHDPLFCASTLTATVILFAASFISSPTLQKILDGHYSGIIFALGILGACGTVLSGLCFTDDSTIAIGSGIVIGCAIAGLTLAWVMVVSLEDLKVLLECFAAALTVVGVLSILCRGISEISLPLAVCVNIAFLVGSVSLLAHIPQDAPLPTIDRTSRPLVWRAGCLAFILGFACQYNWTFFTKANAVYMSTGFSTDYMVGSVIAVILIIFAVLRKKRLGVKLAFIFNLLVFLLVCSLVLALFANEVLYIAYTFNQISYYFAQITLWFISAVLIFKLSDSPQHVGGITFGSMFLGMATAFLVCSHYADVLLAKHVVANASLAIVLVALVFVALFVFRASDLTRLAKQTAIPTANPEVDARLNAIAKKKGLSPRETEVFILLAKGRNAVAIKEKLVISYSTVSTHRQNIYRKLDVHTQQELLDFVEQSMLGSSER